MKSSEAYAGEKRRSDACHGEGLAVVMDVVYNHLGPEGNYFGEYAPIYSESRTHSSLLLAGWSAALYISG